MKKRLVTLVAGLVFAAPMSLQASGLSIYVPYTFEHSVDGTAHKDSYYSGGTSYPASDYNSNYKLKSKVGDIGLAFSTNIGKDKLFGYTLALELKSPEPVVGSGSLTRYDMLHTFEFAVVRTELIHLWVGPRLNLATISYNSDDYTRNGIEVGAAAALGLNVNFGEYFAITSSLDYKMGWQVGTTENKVLNTSYSGTYNDVHTGATFRLGVAYKFGEEFEPSY